MSQFAFLAAEFPEVYSLAARAEGMARTDARGACFYARLSLETIVGWLYRHEASLKSPYENTLAARLHEATFRNLVGPALLAKAKVIKDLGNKAAHEGARAVPSGDGIATVRELFHLAYWLARTYAGAAKPADAIAFSADALPLNKAVPAERLDQLNAAAERFVEAVKARERAEAAQRTSEADRKGLEAEIARLQAEVAAAKAANSRAPDTHDYDEATTRDTFIDLLLRESGWTFTRPGHDTEYRVTGMPNQPGEGFVDYVLWGDDGKPLGIVEAKRTRKDARAGQQQAKLYADCLEAMTGQRPVIFCSNGYEHWIWDDTRYPPRPIQGFLTKDELELSIRRRTTMRPLASAEIDGTIVERYYQTRAIRRVAEAFEKDRSRRALLVMATGSGKTRMVIALADLLMRANWARRILFLADRQALVNQAVGAFRKFLPDASPVNLLMDKNATGRVYVSTYPTMMNLIDKADGGERRFGPGHFDLIVIDEAHRSVYRKYGAIFDYFDSLLVGLTATPKDEVDRDTYRLFDLQRGVPTDAYGLDEAVNDGFLVPPVAVSVPLKFQRSGIRYDDLSEDEKEQWDAVEWDEDGNVPAVIEPAALNQWLFNADTVDKVLEHLMTHGQRVADGDRLGKTIIFAKNQDHARFIVERFDKAYGHLKGSFARVIISADSYAQSLIDDFTQAEKGPHIAVSVDMLDTGIDVPEVVNLVFFKVVRSKTKFWQMLGRGTRLCPDLFGPGQHKTYFSVFDFCQNFEFFNQNPDVTDGAIGESLSKRLFAARVELICALDALHPGGDGVGEDGTLFDHPDDAEWTPARLRETLAALLREEVGGMSLDNFLVRAHRRYIEKFGDEAAWARLSLDDQAELVNEVAGLPTSVTDDDLAAKQFDALILRTQLAVLRAESAFAGLRKKVVELAALLEEMSNIPAVARELALIQEIQGDDFWQDVTAPMLEAVRRRLRALIKLIEVSSRGIVYTDFEDVIGPGAEIEVKGVGAGADMVRFRLKARHFLREHEDHIAVQKLRRNEPLTGTDLAELERIFVEAGVAEPQDLARVEADGGLGLFVRSLVGLDREAAKTAFGAFIAARTLSANQIEFLNMIVEHLTERGQMDPRLLYESPFTDMDPMGVAGLFGDDATAIIDILAEVKRRAAA
ncbi:DEAD/DEAH box helicase family protein [Phenylobacterium sp.]|uniref:DEAD/DEAH box helicase family protein n=1 Tax=Phenylobacterium sp. TaxID=1871053 RepID=UPI002C0F67D5|nr:DEAD/DEAH box helicase family protein [Phenylobacterium sp.]HLZ74831.1 DEAD/DEAH box helicase family protein [Phenylobacterium sp.]